jgi:hypothetical protein
MPPDVAAQILEQSYTCEPGEVSLAVPTEMQDSATQWADALTAACIDPLPEMTLAALGADEQADLFVSAYAPEVEVCKPAFTIPFAIEAADVAFMLAESSTLNLSAKTLAKILNKEITNWSDPAIAAENEGTIFPELDIQLITQADELALQAMSTWLQNQKQALKTGLIKPVAQLEAIELEEGAIAIMPHSQVMANALTAVSVITGTNKETGEQLLALPDNTGIASAASQLVVSKQGQSLTVAVDPGLTPVPQAGMDEAAIPYQAIYAVNLYACNDDTLLQHAMALYLLRLDSQGVLAASNYNPLSDSVRYESLDVARKGLPTPTEVPTE